MKNIILVKVVDLDKSPCNKIVIDNGEENDIKSFECPHHIVMGLIKIVGEIVQRARYNEEPEILQNKTNTESLLEAHHKEFMKELQEIKEEIKNLKANT